jgi:type I restriction enzyme S subunit
MFPAEGETTPRVRFKGFEGVWQMRKIGELGTTYSGLSGKSKVDFGLGSAQYITFLNVLTNAHIDTTIFESVNIKPGEKQNKVVKGDILFNTSSETPEEVGYCSVLMNDIDNLYLNSFCFGFRPYAGTINPEFMVYLMRGQIGRSIMKILAQGATRYNLSKNRLCEVAIPIPANDDEQQQIAAFFSNMDKQIRIQEQRLEKLKRIKTACLENMFV